MPDWGMPCVTLYSLNTNKIAIDVQELLLQTAQIHSSHTGSLEKHRECLEDLTRRVPPSMQDISNTQKETNALLDALLQAVPKLSLRDPSTDQKLPQKEIHQEINRIPDPKKAQKANVVAIPISTTLGQEPTCWSNCACQCHRRHGLKTPAVLSSISGQLLLGYSGSLMLQQRCNVPTCRR